MEPEPTFATFADEWLDQRTDLAERTVELYACRCSPPFRHRTEERRVSGFRG